MSEIYTPSTPAADGDGLVTPTLLPAPPFVRFGVVVGPVWTVVRDGVAIGEICLIGQDRGIEGCSGWYQWRIPGMRCWAPTQSGTRCEAIQRVEQEADRPMAARRGIPAELRIAGLMKEQARQEGTGDR